MIERETSFVEKHATLVVDGVEREINRQIYGENAVLVFTDAFEESPAEFTGRGREPYRAALVVEDGAIAENMSVRPALVGGTVSDTGLEGVSITSTTDDFSHVIVVNSEYSLKDCKFVADTESDGKRVCDFNGYATFLIRSTTSNIIVDNSILNPGDGILLQMIDNDDKAVGGAFKPDIYDENGKLIQAHEGPIFNHEFFEHPGFPGLDYECVPQAGKDKVTARFTNCALSGDVYNATGFRNLGDGSRGQGEELELTLGAGCTLSGVITASTSMHVDEKGRPNNLFTQEQYYYLGHVTNKPYANGVNNVRLTLTDDAVWTVTGESLLAELCIGENASVIAPAGKSLLLTVDGEAVELCSGKAYTGAISLTIA